MIAQVFVNRFKDLETPFYFYDLELLRRTVESALRESRKFDFLIHYALKANNNDAVLKTIRDYGIGADCVSGNEVEKCIKTGFPRDKIVFAGVGKTDKEIRTALEHDIFCFNCESVPEIEVISQIASHQRKTAPIAIRINPDVDPKTHKFIATGLKDSKFGINHQNFKEVAEKLKSLPNLKLKGIHFHIGSQITDIKVFEQLSLKINVIQDWFSKNGFDFEHINVGGGLGIDYRNPDEMPVPDFQAYFQAFHRNLKLRTGQKLHVELGRSLVGQCGYFITKVLYLKNGYDTKFLIVDGGMNDLLRPMLYQAYHKFSSLTSSNPPEKYVIAGPVCESTDIFTREAFLPGSERGDLLAVHSVGAYCQVMASTYNMRSLVKAYDSDSLI